MSKTEREARRDAREYARAEMFYGEGAGTRRKLIQATVESKAAKDPHYAHAFRTELNHQDMAEHAAKARSERRRKDVLESTRKNTKAVVSGNYQNAQTGVLILIVAGYFAHQTGLDKKALEEAKKLKTKVENKYHIWKIKRQLAKVSSDNHDKTY